MANGTIHKLGTLYVGNEPIKRPTKPWYGTNGSAPETGNLYNYDENKGDISIGNTHSDDSYKIQWIEVNDGSEKLLICDRNLICTISYNSLTSAGFTKGKGSGKTIAIDGRTYELFMLTGGTNWNVPQETVPTNEWSKYIVNLENISGLPIPTYEDLDEMSSSANFNTAHNQIWHWAGCYSWCIGDPLDRVYAPIRGSLSCKNYVSEIRNNIFNVNGWRPALRVLEPEQENRYPQIEPSNAALGSFSQPTDIDFTISDPDGDYFNVTISIDYVEKEYYTSQYGPKTFTLELSRYWSELNTGSHNITIDVEDANKNQTIKTYTFQKTNVNPTITPTSQYLGSLTRPKDFSFTIYHPNDKMTLTFKIDREVIETWSQQSSGQKTCSILTSQWSRIGLGSHTISIVVTDSHQGSATATYTFDKTNNAAASPTILSPLYDGRVSPDFYIEFNIGEDPEGDSQTVTIQIANNQYMTSGLQEFSSQIEKYNGSSWEPISGTRLTNSDAGKKLRMRITGVSSGVKYIRVGSLDVGSGQYSYSSVNKINVGQSYLEIKTHPSVCETMPSKIIVLLSLVAGTQALKEISVCNNANDSAPTWETYTPDSSGMYTFTNKTKTASDWAVSAKIKVSANGYTGEISLSAIGLGVL